MPLSLIKHAGVSACKLQFAESVAFVTFMRFDVVVKWGGIRCSLVIQKERVFMIEKWDAYDKYFNKIADGSLIRGEVIPDGVYHLVGEIIVKHTDGTYLLMQRDYKKQFGGKWELTAGGSALQGESPLECAIRELREETGIVCSDLKELKRVVHDGHHSLFVEYLCVTKCDKNSIVLQEGETVDYKWVNREDILKMGEDTLASSRALECMMHDEV